MIIRKPEIGKGYILKNPGEGGSPGQKKRKGGIGNSTNRLPIYETSYV
jgi:hypothetical protein